MNYNEKDKKCVEERQLGHHETVESLITCH